MARYSEPTEVVTVAEVLALAELKVLAEIERLKLLQGGEGHTELTRLENLIRHKEDRLDRGTGEKSTDCWDADSLVLSENQAKY
jgi:hypothetical protein